MKAVIWRMLMSIGMKFHQFASPRPPSPSFKVVVPSRLSCVPGTFKLVFYVPDSYFTSTDDGYRFPVVVNYHGGGFTLGTGTDDARWASAIVQQLEAVFVSVEYRLAPEYPFSVGVEDGTDAVIYLAAHAEELRLDPHRIALSGFSAGGNFALTVPLMLHDLINHQGKRSLSRLNSYDDLTLPSTSTPGTPLGPLRRKYSPLSLAQTASASASNLHLSPPKLASLRSHSSSSLLKLTDLEPTALEMEQKVPELTIKCLVSFYPPVDFRITREEKRATNPLPNLNLSHSLANLFDDSYLHPRSVIDASDPYLSPMAAPDALLSAAYPDEIILYTCEYDMLNAEGVAFGSRLSSEPINKAVHGGLIRGVPHAFDRKPNPLSFPKEAERCYSEACAELARLFGQRQTSFEERRQLEHSRHVQRFSDSDDGLDVEPEEPDNEVSRGLTIY
ncbi:Alpha/Beta hydrolase protein [Xylogone sp. PMI_703]|nr:Alpha/Beta hydrolase protein [Xylogone sp. PMI_703]